MILGLRDLRQGPEECKFIGGILFVTIEDALDQMERMRGGFVEAGEFCHTPLDACTPKRVVNGCRFPHAKTNPFEQQLKFWWWQFGEQSTVRVTPCLRIHVISRNGNRDDKCAGGPEDTPQCVNGIEDFLLGQMHQYRRAEHPVELSIIELR